MQQIAYENLKKVFGW